MYQKKIEGVRNLREKYGQHRTLFLLVEAAPRWKFVYLQCKNKFKGGKGMPKKEEYRRVCWLDALWFPMCPPSSPPPVMMRVTEKIPRRKMWSIMYYGCNVVAALIVLRLGASCNGEDVLGEEGRDRYGVQLQIKQCTYAVAFYSTQSWFSSL